jgi:hypothetical protein
MGETNNDAAISVTLPVEVWEVIGEAVARSINELNKPQGWDSLYREANNLTSKLQKGLRAISKALEDTEV